VGEQLASSLQLTETKLDHRNAIRQREPTQCHVEECELDWLFDRVVLSRRLPQAPAGALLQDAIAALANLVEKR